jgi:uncharacterized membrane protein
MARKIALILAAFFYTVAGSLHFLHPGPYLKIMPPQIPWHLPMIYLSGAAEIAGGIGLLIPILRRPAAWGLTALLIAVFPANIYMAINHIRFTQIPIPTPLLWARLALQPLFIWWVLWCSRAADGFPAAGSLSSRR